MTLQKRSLTWNDIEKLATNLVDRLPNDYEAMLIVTRGGLVPGCIISEMMNIRNILVAAVMTYLEPGQTMDRPIFLQFPDDLLLADKRVLVVDDVWDSGKTVMAIKERLEAVGCRYDVATLHYKPARSRYNAKPEYYVEETDDWIVYPWDPEHESYGSRSAPR